MSNLRKPKTYIYLTTDSPQNICEESLRIQLHFKNMMVLIKACVSLRDVQWLLYVCKFMVVSAC